jgi:hypothetical protein
MTPDTGLAVQAFAAARVNPFATRFLRPGVVPPLDDDGRPLPLDPLLERLRAAGCLVIEGPHGRGKTTLVRGLLAAASTRGRETLFLQLRSFRDAWKAVATVAAARPGSLVAVDGWERFPPPLGWLLPLLARRRQVTVVTTSHRPCGLPVLARCTSSARQLAAVVRRLPGHGGLITEDDIEQAFRHHAGNIRDALGELYDVFERRSSREPSARA